jgi:hypothetical protein
MYIFHFYSPQAIGFGRFRPENGQKRKSRQSCKSCLKEIFKKMPCGHRIQLRLVDSIDKFNLTYSNYLLFI